MALTDACTNESAPRQHHVGGIPGENQDKVRRNVGENHMIEDHGKCVSVPRVGGAQDWASRGHHSILVGKSCFRPLNPGSGSGSDWGSGWGSGSGSGSGCRMRRRQVAVSSWVVRMGWGWAWLHSAAADANLIPPLPHPRLRYSERQWRKDRVCKV